MSCTERVIRTSIIKSPEQSFKCWEWQRTKVMAEASSSAHDVSITVSYNKQALRLTVSSSTTLSELFANHLDIHADSATSVFKVIFKGRTVHFPGPDGDATLESLGVAEGSKLLVVGSSTQAIKSLEAEGDYERRRAAAHEAGKGKTVKVRDTSDRSVNPYTFHRIVPLPASPIAPFFEERKAMLERLRDDPAVKSVMKEMEFQVGDLGELHPHIDPTLLGVNENAGQRIRLRLLTDRLDGLRSYSMVLRVLDHELAHNKFGPHDNDFKALDSLIVKKVAAHKAAARASGHRLGGDLGDHYEPPEQIEASCSTSSTAVKTPTAGPVFGSTVAAMGEGNVLGGTNDGGSAGAAEDRRRAAAEAAMRRAHNETNRGGDA